MTKSDNTESESPQIREEPSPKRIPMASKGILQTKSSTIPQKTLLGSHNRIETQCPKLLTRKSILSDATRTSSAKGVSEETTGKGVYLTV
jgi:hypothetical protein